jgi:hypothetical protein
MSDLLAIVDGTSNNEALVEEIVRRHPHRVTILVEDAADPDWASDESQPGRALRDRMAALLTAIEQRTGAVVVGLAGSRDQLTGWRFDRTIGGPSPLPV